MRKTRGKGTIAMVRVHGVPLNRRASTSPIKYTNETVDWRSMWSATGKWYAEIEVSETVNTHFQKQERSVRIHLGKGNGRHNIK